MLSVVKYIPYTNMVREMLCTYSNFQMSYRYVIPMVSLLIYQYFNYHTFSKRCILVSLRPLFIRKLSGALQFLVPSLGALLLVAMGRCGNKLRGQVPKV